MPDTNVNSNLWAQATRVYIEDSGVVDRAQGTRRKHQLAFEKMGINAKTVRDRVKELDLSSDERQAMFAEEQISRRALSLWDADSPEEFEQTLERASQTPAADIDALDAIAGERAYSDGFNGGAHGGQTVDDNKHVPGTLLHQRWAIGCEDGIEYMAKLDGTPLARSSAPMEANGSADHAEREAAPKKSRGRPRKTPMEHLEANAAKLNGDAEPPDAPPVESMFEDMPDAPGMPE